MQLINVSPPSQRSCVASTIDATRAQISDRSWKSGDRLPSESALVEQFGGARYTVRDALRFLVNWR